MSGPQFTQLQSTGLSGLGAMLESHHELKLKPKTVPEFKNALQLIWSALSQKAIDKAVAAGMCVSQRWTFWTFNVIIHLTDTNSYI